MDNIITIGLGFGDEGKGSFIYYLAKKCHDYKYFVKYNGGCQAKHTIKIGKETYSFAQLSPSLLVDNTYTVLGSNYVMNPINLLVECEFFDNNYFKYNNIQMVLDRVLIDKNCVCVTPYHKIYNQIEEKSKKRRGSVGIGVSIAGLWKIKNGILYAKDLNNETKLREVLKRQKNYAIERCSKEKLPYDDIINYDIENYINNVLYNMRTFNFHIIDTQKIIEKNKCIFESSQGLLLDKEKGIYPNTTYLDTTLNSLENLEGNRIGFIRAFYTRHGPGVFPTEMLDLKNFCFDDVQEVGEFNGSIRTGYFDLVLFRYALKETGIDIIFMSYLDILNNVKNMLICNEYLYEGRITKEFDELFEYKKTEIGYQVSNIKKMSKNVGKYLNQMSAIFTNIVFGNVTFDEKAKIYIEEIEKLSNIKIRLYSKGPQIEDKVVV